MNKDWSIAIALVALIAAVVAVEWAQFQAMVKTGDRVSRLEGRQDAFIQFLSSPLTDEEEKYLIRRRLREFEPLAEPEE